MPSEPLIARQLDQLYEVFKYLVETVSLDASFQFNHEDGAFIRVSKLDLDDPENAGTLVVAMMGNKNLHLVDDVYSFKVVVRKDSF